MAQCVGDMPRRNGAAAVMAAFDLLHRHAGNSEKNRLFYQPEQYKCVIDGLCDAHTARKNDLCACFL